MWSYKIKQINNSISLLEDTRKIGTLYGADSSAEKKARLIVSVPEMCKLLVECTEYLENNSSASGLVRRIEALLVNASTPSHD